VTPADMPPIHVHRGPQNIHLLQADASEDEDIGPEHEMWDEWLGWIEDQAILDAEPDEYDDEGNLTVAYDGDHVIIPAWIVAIVREPNWASHPFGDSGLVTLWTGEQVATIGPDAVTVELVDGMWWRLDRG